MSGVLHVITGLGSGGAEAMLSQIAIALCKSGHPQHVVSLNGRGDHASILEANGVPVTDLAIASALSAPSAMLRLARIMRNARPAVVQGWMYHGNIAAALAYKARSAPARLLWNLRASNMDKKRYGRIIKWNARLSHWPDVVISNSGVSLGYHKDYGFNPQRTEVIPNGIDTGHYAPATNQRKALRRELGIDQHALVAMHVARVDPMKDHANFLAALGGLSDVQGVLVGKDTRSLLLPENVMALGYRRDINRLHHLADIIVSSSAFGEGFSNALAEGMASGLVPVSTDVGDARLIVGNVGDVVEPRNNHALRSAIGSLAALGPQMLHSRGMAARQHIIDNFSLSRAVERYRLMYELETA